MIQQWLSNCASNHYQWLAGIAVGAIMSHPVSVASSLFGLAVRVPWIGAYVAAHPKEVKAWFDDFDKAIDACVDKYAGNGPAPKQ